MNRPQPAKRDQGSSSVETVLIMPLLALLVFAIVQFAVYFHALQLAQMAADQGLDAARVQNGTSTDGTARAEAYLASLAGGVLKDGHAQVVRTAGTVQARVSGRVEQLVPFLHLTVTAHATGPVEAAP